jgi:hypothetical protein
VSLRSEIFEIKVTRWWHCPSQKSIKYNASDSEEEYRHNHE